jgi:plastocyanin
MMAMMILPAYAVDAVSPKNVTGQENVTINLVAVGYVFNASTITVPAGSNVTVNFDNQDGNVRHNFALYDSSAMKKTIFKGELIIGPQKIIYNFIAPNEIGTYHFQCDPHARMMNGQFIVK